MGTSLGSTSQYRQIFSQHTWTLVPDTRFGLSVGFPVALRRSRQRHFRARPESMAASLEPVVDVPVALSLSSGEFHRSARMSTHRASISAVSGYSSLSIMF